MSKIFRWMVGSIDILTWELNASTNTQRRADKVKGDSIETDPDTLNITIREPLGVCGLIIPV